MVLRSGHSSKLRGAGSVRTTGRRPRVACTCLLYTSYLNEARSEAEKRDLAMIIEETLRQRYEGVKNEAGVWVTPAFPKLIYVLEEDNVREGSEYFYLCLLYTSTAPA